ncbi:hypothetical protein BGW80DRAFT_605304 [Lactifluus volemus]|nr:hypothetical protein BGW80DRAFT_605304 [Lactifluus volemus]
MTHPDHDSSANLDPLLILFDHLLPILLPLTPSCRFAVPAFHVTLCSASSTLSLSTFRPVLACYVRSSMILSFPVALEFAVALLVLVLVLFVCTRPPRVPLASPGLPLWLPHSFYIPSSLDSAYTPPVPSMSSRYREKHKAWSHSTPCVFFTTYHIYPLCILYTILYTIHTASCGPLY